MAENKSEKIEREYTIPLRREWHKVPRYKRTNKAVKAIKEFLARHMKIYDRDLRKIKVDKYLNEEIWNRGIKNPPAKIKVKAVKEGDIVHVELFDMPEKLKFKKAREEKREEKAAQTKEKHVHEHKHEETKPEGEGEEKKAETEEKKKEAEEKQAATIEGMEKIEKETAKKMRHEKGGKTKEPKHRYRQALKK